MKMTIRLLAIALTFGLGCGDFNTTPTCGSTGQGCCHGLCADGLVCTSGFCGRAILPEGCPAIRPTMCGVSCTNTTSDRTNCGRCGNACADAQACSGGTCNLACVAGTTNCTGACRDVTNDNNNCGACGRACAGDQICSNGMCTVSCGVGQTSCSSVCRDLSSDIANCGACDNACTVAQTCAAGSCVTPAPTCPGGMRLIPAGMFLMGDPTAADSDASPIHAVRLTAFCMDETEVSVSAYAACATCSSPATGGACNWGVVGRGSHPVNCVDWNMARAYCQARGGIFRRRRSGSMRRVARMVGRILGATTRRVRSCVGIAQTPLAPCARTHQAIHHLDCLTWRVMCPNGRRIGMQHTQDLLARMSRIRRVP